MTTDATDTTEADDATDDDGPDEAHRRPDGLDDATVAALGELSAALEIVEQARGFLYGFHRLTGKADLALGDAVDSLRDAGHAEIADLLERDLVGRNVVEGRWTYQLVEDYDDGYHAAFREHEKNARDALAGGRRHLFEAEMKEARRSHGRRHHEALPRDRADVADRAAGTDRADRDADEADGTTEPTA